MNNPFAFVFPGQGSQQVGMLSELAGKFSIIKRVFDEASNILNYDLWSLTEKGPEEQLNQTEHTQPALLTAGYAMWRLWRQHNAPLPSWVAGHSLGEYTALVCAKALDFPTAVQLVALRGKLMQEAVPAGIGAMAAVVGLSDQTVQEICSRASHPDQQVTPANYNSIGQVVIAGEINAVDRAVVIAKECGAKLAKKLPVSVPSHCALMKPAAMKLEQKLKTISFKRPEIPVIHNVSVSCYQDSQQIQDALVRQLYSPVRWVETIQLLVQHGVQTVFESGPGRVLTGLNKRISDSLATIALTNLDSFNEALSHIGETA